MPFSWESEEAVFRKEMERLPEYAEAASEMGCTRCLATVAPATDDRPYHENFEFHRTRFAEICEVLQKTNTWLGLGFRAAADLRQGKSFQFIHEQDALGLLLNMVSMPNIGLVVDLWDLVVAGGEVESIRSIPVNQVVAVQIADMPADTPLAELTEANRMLPGKTGKPDIAAALKILSEAGYEGPVTIKPAKKAADSRRRDPVAKAAGLAMHRAFKSADLPGAQTQAILRAEREEDERKAEAAGPSDDTSETAPAPSTASTTASTDRVDDRDELRAGRCEPVTLVFGAECHGGLGVIGVWNAMNVTVVFRGPRQETKKRPDPACGSGRSSCDAKARRLPDDSSD